MSSTGFDRLVGLLLPEGGFVSVAAPVSLTIGSLFYYSFSTAVSEFVKYLPYMRNATGR